VEQLRKPRQWHGESPPVFTYYAVSIGGRYEEGRRKQWSYDDALNEVISTKDQDQIIDKPQHPRLCGTPPLFPLAKNAKDHGGCQ
jgi:hypothetical protein